MTPQEQCKVETCERPTRTKGYCGAHYARHKRGTPLDAPLQPTGDAETRFWAKVDRSGGPDACWPWLGSCHPAGHGEFSMGTRTNRRRSYTHRFAYELLVGPIPAGLVACHRCDNPPCCNPAHIFLGTQADNVADMTAKRRHWAHAMTHCKQGHEFSDDNTQIYTNPTTGQRQRVCLTCRRASNARRKRGANRVEGTAA